MSKISIETANKMLSLVRPITKQMTEAWEQIVETKTVLKDLSSEEESELFAKTIRIFNRATSTISKNLNELENLGCIVESYEEGVIDFPSLIDGEDVMLCWKLNEKEVLHYHKRGEVYNQRLLITQILEQ